MKHIKISDIEYECTVCPYCMSEVSIDVLGCCGESSAHFETAFIIDDEMFLKSEIIIIDENN